jgi:uncharacterized phiE125 gp8 family phage protein
MNRTIITPAALPSAALAELKQWLGITIPADDAPLTALLRAAIEVCEAFTGAMPLVQGCEEVLRDTGCWQALATRPVLAITGVARIGLDGARTALPGEGYALELDDDGAGRLRVLAPGEGRVAVAFTAGLAAEWDALPEGLRHGIVRLAANEHRERETSGAALLPPASVAALWRPWRRLRLS